MLELVDVKILIVHGRYITLINCNLCDAGFMSPDSLLKERLRRHEDFHLPKAISRNVNIGYVRWDCDDNDLLYHARKHEVVLRAKMLVCKTCSLILESDVV